MSNETVVYERHFIEKLGFSVEIPNNWQKIENYPFMGAGTEGYFYPTNLAHDPQIFFNKTVLKLRKQIDNFFETFADQLMQSALKNLASEQFEIITQIHSKIDDFPARIDVFVFQSPNFEVPVTQYQVCWQNHQTLYALVGMVESTQELEYLPIFETVAASIRYQA
ncbi:hypothetical protein ACQFX9_13665 [Aliinostoc sp. HNIBRCY26]|uniref:hypothetical protein n=1 Tax=Aliinostoc sp. HNIBRCY26 TaxID=3418997 RepID=UPI003CFCA548